MALPTCFARWNSLYPTDEGAITGVIDLVFEKEGKIYLLDWKSNWLPDYSEKSLIQEMEAHDYFLQASLYREALTRHFNMPFGGTYYIFLRGLPNDQGVLFIDE
jgi:exodeoxyribonuclease V beta subunit